MRMLNTTTPRRTFVGSADVAPGGASTGPVTRLASEAISHPVPLPPLLTREDWRAARESILLGPPVSTKCVASDVVHACARDYHSDDRHFCRECSHEWNGPLGATNRPATSDNDLCFAKKQANYVEMEIAS